MNTTALQVASELKKYANPKRAAFVAGYFKTGEGEYGAGDVFWGLSVPHVREIARRSVGLPVEQTLILLHSPVHEQRQCALMIWVVQFAKADEKKRKQIYTLYLQNTRYINNWDLIDLTAREIVGRYLLDKPKERKILYKLAKSGGIWERRIAIISAWAFVKYNEETRDMVAISTLLLSDKHDLIHKATGWMLREMGKVDEKKLYSFLHKNASIMPQTMLRYSIERLPTELRKKYMSAKAKQ